MRPSLRLWVFQALCIHKCFFYFVVCVCMFFLNFQIFDASIKYLCVHLCIKKTDYKSNICSYLKYKSSYAIVDVCVFCAFDFTPFLCLKATSSPAFAHNRMIKRRKKIQFVSSFGEIYWRLRQKTWQKYMSSIVCVCWRKSKWMKRTTFLFELFKVNTTTTATATTSSWNEMYVWLNQKNVFYVWIDAVECLLLTVT